VNGLRAVLRNKKDFLKWFKETKADIFCLQEIRVNKEQFPEKLFLKEYHLYFNSAKKKGYAGVAVYTKQRPKQVEYRLGFKKFDSEGRILKLRYPDFLLINLYLPHGGRQKENLGYKIEAYKHLLAYLKRNKNRNLILTGDFNIAHQEIDLARPKQNKNNIMFTKEERRQIDEIIKLGFVDSFRKFNKEKGHYTWWPYFAKARERNLGWRIDYIFVSRKMGLKLKDAFILKKIRGSDHCPIGIEV